jgi:hypothetical protein
MRRRTIPGVVLCPSEAVHCSSKRPTKPETARNENLLLLGDGDGDGVVSSAARLEICQISRNKTIRSRGESLSVSLRLPVTETDRRRASEPGGQATEQGTRPRPAKLAASEGGRRGGEVEKARTYLTQGGVGGAVAGADNQRRRAARSASRVAPAGCGVTS